MAEKDAEFAALSIQNHCAARRNLALRNQRSYRLNEVALNCALQFAGSELEAGALVKQQLPTGSRALQLISGATKIVTSRSRRFSITRVAIIPGTAQANDDNSGINDFPDNPIRDISLSIK